MKAQRAAKQITLGRTEAVPGDQLYVSGPKLNEDKVLVSGSPALRFDINLKGGYANNFLVQNVTRALVAELDVKFGGTTLQDTVDKDTNKRSEACSSQSNSATTWYWRGSRIITCAKYTPKSG